MTCYQTRLDRVYDRQFIKPKTGITNPLQHTVLVPVYIKSVPTYTTPPGIPPTTGKQDATGDGGKQVSGSLPENFPAVDMW